MPSLSRPDEPIAALLLLGDTHCGSRVGLLPPDCLDAEGAVYSQNQFQAWLWQKWQLTIERATSIISNRKWAMVCMGDLTEGDHHRNKEIVDPDTGAHAAIAKAALSPLADKADEVFCIEGTECHTGNGESSIAFHLGSHRDPSTGSFSFKQLTLNVNGVICSFKHHCSASSRQWLESGEYSRILASERLVSLEAKQHPPDIVVRAHRHRGGHHIAQGGMCIVTHPWQGQTRHVRKVVPASVPVVGMHLLDFDEMTNGLPRVHDIRHTADPDPVVML